MLRTLARSLLWVVLPMLLSSSVVAQVPPHQPGSICFTPQFWCWMQVPMYPGQFCYCMSPYGPVQGVTG